MAIVGISEPARTPRRWSPWALAFRPFFLLGGLSALLLLAYWGHAYGKGLPVSAYYGFIGWHSHEILFGYGAAIITGFLLTAARNWTGVQTVHGLPLALLAGIWLLARLLAFTSAPPPLIAAVDLAFLPLVAWYLWHPLWKVRQVKNYVFVGIALGLALANLLVHLELLGLTSSAHGGTYMAVDLLVLILVMMGGRVIPFFTEKGVAIAFTPREWRWVEIASPLSVLALALLEGFAAPAALVGLAAGLAALVNGLRLYGWYTSAIWRAPLVWVLQLGYAWLVLGLALRLLAAFGGFSDLLALHALTIGGIGGITLGMMARVSLGHTGRSLALARPVPWAFVLLYLAAALRTFLPMLGVPYALGVTLASIAWIMAFALFLWVYALMLLKPRIDGAPG